MNIFTSSKSVVLVTKIKITIVIIISIVIAILSRHRALTGQHFAHAEECSQTPGMLLWAYISVKPDERAPRIIGCERIQRDVVIFENITIIDNI